MERKVWQLFHLSCSRIIRRLPDEPGNYEEHKVILSNNVRSSRDKKAWKFSCEWSYVKPFILIFPPTFARFNLISNLKFYNSTMSGNTFVLCLKWNYMDECKCYSFFFLFRTKWFHFFFLSNRAFKSWNVRNIYNWNWTNVV